MDINDIKHLALERIYLVPDTSEGQLGYVWCDDPAPGEGMDASEAVEYVRKDVADARIAELERERDMHKAAEEAQIALRQKMERERDQAAANANRLRAALHYCNEYLYGSHLNTIGHGSKAHMEIVNAIGETPVTSLARRDAEQRGKALAETAKWFAGLHTSTELLSAEVVYDILMDQSRRQAEAEQ